MIRRPGGRPWRGGRVSTSPRYSRVLRPSLRQFLDNGVEDGASDPAYGLAGSGTVFEPVGGQEVFELLLRWSCHELFKDPLEVSERLGSVAADLRWLAERGLLRPLMKRGAFGGAHRWGGRGGG